MSRPRPAMAMRPQQDRQPTTTATTAYEHAKILLVRAVKNLTAMPRKVQHEVASLWNSAAHWARRGMCKRHKRACQRLTDVIAASLTWQRSDEHDQRGDDDGMTHDKEQNDGDGQQRLVPSATANTNDGSREAGTGRNSRTRHGCVTTATMTRVGATETHTTLSRRR